MTTFPDHWVEAPPAGIDNEPGEYEVFDLREQSSCELAPARDEMLELRDFKCDQATYARRLHGGIAVYARIEIPSIPDVFFEACIEPDEEREALLMANEEEAEIPNGSIPEDVWIVLGTWRSKVEELLPPSEPHEER